MKKTILLLATGFVFLNMTAQKPTPLYLDDNQPIEKRIENALSLMTLDEKIAMCHAQSKFSSPGVERLGIPEIWWSDGPHGIREEVYWDEWTGANWTNDSCTAFPALTSLAATFNPELSKAYGIAIGEEARYRGKDVLLGPGVNIYRTPLNGRNFEYMGEDPYLASTMVVPYIQGVQQNGVAACVKHFALNNQEEWRGHINVNLSDRALYEIYLPAFKAAVTEAKVWSIMGAYNQIRGQHCCHNDLLLNKILKTDWKFDGVVVSDWGGVHDTRQAALYGLDVEMGTYTDGLTSKAKFDYKDYYLAQPFLAQIKKGEIPEAVLNDKVSRILRLIFRTNMNRNRPYGKFVSPEHSQTALRIAEEGIVLLKNENNILPVASEKYTSIAVIGENAVKTLTLGGGSSSLKVKYEVSPLEGLVKIYGKDKIHYSMGYSSGPSAYDKVVPPVENQDSLLKSAVEIASKADVILFFGGLNKNQYQDCEGGDRKSYDLPFGQNRLISEILKVNKNLVIVLTTGNAVAMPWIKEVPAIIQNWYNGSENGNAIARVISGAVNPSGKLPFSFPVKLEDNAAHSFGKLSYPGDSINQYYKEDILVGYRWFDTRKIKPLFPFGYGLSYTSFGYGKIATDKKEYAKDETVNVTFTLKNTGTTDGYETVQIYASQPKASVIRPVKELKGFKKVFLQPGETATVTIPIRIQDLAFYDERTGNWNVEAGEFVFHNASSAADVKSSVKIRVK
jgi:beta-glucosidase